jgi:hypothetical protein
VVIEGKSKRVQAPIKAITVEPVDLQSLDMQFPPKRRAALSTFGLFSSTAYRVIMLHIKESGLEKLEKNSQEL